MTTRARGWYTVSQSSGFVLAPGQTGTTLMAPDLQDPTLLRTRAYFSTSAVGHSAPPIYPGNNLAPFGFRVLVHTFDDPPDIQWPEQARGVDDVIFHPLIWGDTFLVPAAPEFGRPENIYGTAEPAGGIADSAAMRHMPGLVDVHVSWYVGPLLGSDSVANPEFTVRWWIRCLIEATI